MKNVTFAEQTVIRSDEVLLRSRARNFLELARLLELGEKFSIVCSDFMDEFYHADKKDRQSFIDFEPPEIISSLIKDVDVVLIAGMAERFAHLYGLKVPAWVENSKYFNPIPDYCGWGEEQLSDDHKRAFQNHTPDEFSRRNLYVSENCLSRY
jgi:hypothetical protein